MAKKIALVISLELLLALTSQFGASAQTCVSPPPGIVSWWPGDGSGDDAVDSNGPTTLNAGFGAGKVFQAFTFDGVDDYASFSSTGISDLQELSIEAWVRLDALPGRIMRFVSIQAEKAVLRYSGSGSLEFYLRIDNQLWFINAAVGWQLGTFHHVAGTYDGAAMRLYFDGVPVGSLARRGSVRTGDSGIFFGSPAEPLKGALDEVAVYDRALSRDEVAAIFIAGSQGKCRCGNGRLDPGEECDDSNNLDGDCCSSTCEFEQSDRCELGDCDPDGAIDIFDVLHKIRIITQRVTPTPREALLCDDDCDGDIDIFDVLREIDVILERIPRPLTCSGSATPTLTPTPTPAPTSTARFVDNGDGTVTDNQTGLQWEKKDAADGVQNYANPHDVDNRYTWSASGIAPDGTAFADFLATLNTPPCFAGHCDWRLPKVNRWGDPAEAELETILLAPYPCSTNPCIDPIFGPTFAYFYWSATTYGGNSFLAWCVNFGDGNVGAVGKPGDLPAELSSVRAVRSGL